MILQPLDFFEFLLAPLTLQTHQFLHIQKHKQKTWGGNLISAQWLTATLNPTSFFFWGKIPLLHHLSKSVVRFWGSKLPEQHPWRFTEAQNYFILFFSPETNIPGIRFSGLIWRLSGFRVVFRYSQLNSSIHYIIYIILCHWTWPPISKYLLKEMWTHTHTHKHHVPSGSLFSTIAICSLHLRPQRTVHAKGLGRILNCGGWCVGARNRGARCTWEHAEFNTWPKSLLGSTNAQKKRVQLVMSIGNIYIYTYIYTPMAWSNVEHDREETRFRFSFFPHPALGYLWILVDNCTRKPELVSSTSFEFFF